MHFFNVTDLIEKGQVQIAYFPTNAIIAHYNTKGLVGSKFINFQDMRMNLLDTSHQIGQQECDDKQIDEHDQLHGQEIRMF
jgi:hypothetical protein